MQHSLDCCERLFGRRSMTQGAARDAISLAHPALFDQRSCAPGLRARLGALLALLARMAGKHPPLEPRSPRETADVRAVVADDDDDNRALFVAVLRRDGFEASEVRNGNELVECVTALRRDGGDALVVISDVNMPECNGIQAARRLRRICLTLPIVLVTASTDPRTWRDAAAAGVDAVLQKPVPPHVLTRAVRRAMGA